MFSFTIKYKEINHKEAETIKQYVLNNSSCVYDEENYEYLFILGGDGAFLKYVHDCIIKLKKFEIIVVAINMGQTGFFMQFENQHSDFAKILRNIASRQSNKIFKILAYEAEISNVNEIKTVNFINDILFFSQAKAVNLSVYINKKHVKKHVKKQVSLLNEDYYKLLSQRGSGYIISTALGNFALMHSTGGSVFLDRSKLLTLKLLFPINNKRERAINNSFIFAAETQLSITSGFDKIVPISNQHAKNIKKLRPSYQDFFTGRIIIDGQREYLAPLNLKITGNYNEIKILKPSSVSAFWRDRLTKII